MPEHDTTIVPGTRIGPYEILNHAGSGGMGDVYKARDTRLNRTVAIKVLPEAFSADADRRQRFEREARVVASLSHPNICALHDVGVVPTNAPGDATRSYLVMEYLDGETLAERLTRGALPTNQVGTYGAAIARALDAAHRQHIVHRDLKPGNIMLTRAGVKLLDFGLAKTADPVSQGSGDSTQAISNLTMAGAVLGTLPYMSPEQLQGSSADQRSDIFALGAVLYEMTTGGRAFTGSSAADVSAAILTSEPPPLPSAGALDGIIRTCLEKNPDHRWQSAHDVAIQLESFKRRDEATPVTSRQTKYLPWTVAAAAIALAVIALMAATRDPSDSAEPGVPAVGGVVAFPLPPPALGAFTYSVEGTALAVAPDGSAIAYSARGPDGVVKLWLRPIDSADARPLDGTEGATSMFWSPDSRSIAFFAGGKLKRLEAAAGAPVTICDVREGIGQMGTWGADGRILFASVQGEALLEVDASGGTVTQLRKPGGAEGPHRLTWPMFLPDGRSYLYQAVYPDDTGVVMFSPPKGEPRRVMEVKSNVEYVDPGYLLFASDASLVARRFDPVTGTVSGDPIVVSGTVKYFKATGLAHFSAGRRGVVAYQPHGDEARIALFDRSGRQSALVRTSGDYGTVSLSPDGRKLLFSRLDQRVSTFDIWMLELERGVENRVTNDASTDAFPLWGPAGTLIFSVAKGSAPRLFRRELATGKDQELSPHGVGLQQPTSVSADGQLILYAQRTPRGNFDLMVRRLSDNSTVSFRDSPADESDGRFSPDGRFVAYSSDGTGRSEVLVAPFSSGPGTTVSIEGGRSPRWSVDGRELFFIAADGELMAAPIRATPVLEVGRPARLFTTHMTAGPWADYAVTPDGRFIAIVRTQIGSQQPMTVIVNWPATLLR
jgi:eukaryotic-like serine/threonine-protein kinase